MLIYFRLLLLAFRAFFRHFADFFRRESQAYRFTVTPSINTVTASLTTPEDIRDTPLPHNVVAQCSSHGSPPYNACCLPTIIDIFAFFFMLLFAAADVSPVFIMPLMPLADAAADAAIAFRFFAISLFAFL